MFFNMDKNNFQVKRRIFNIFKTPLSSKKELKKLSALKKDMSSGLENLATKNF